MIPTNEYLVDNEIIPLIEGKSYLHNEIIVLFQNKLGADWLKNLLLQRFNTVSTGFIMTVSQFKEELYSSLLWDKGKANQIVMTENAKTLIMKETLEKYISEISTDSYFKSIWEYRSFRVDLLKLLSTVKKQLIDFDNNEVLFELDRFKNLYYHLISTHKELEGKYTEIYSIFSMYEEMKLDFSLIDKDDMDYYICNYLIKNKTSSLWYGKTCKIMLFNVSTLSNIDFKLIDTLKKCGIDFRISFFYDLDRENTFQNGKLIKDMLDLLGFKEEKIDFNYENTYSNNKSCILNNLSVDIFNENIILNNKNTYLQKDTIPNNGLLPCLMVSKDYYDEILMVGKRIKWLLCRKPALRADDILIVIRNIDKYKDVVNEVFKKLNLPIYQQFKYDFTNEKLIGIILQILELRINEFSSESVVPFIKSNYIFLSGDLLGLSHSNTRLIVQNINKYYEKIKNSKKDILTFLKSLKASNKNKHDELDLCILYLEKLKEIIYWFPSPQTKISLTNLIQYFKKLITSTFSILYNVYNCNDLDLVQRDSIVLQNFLRVLDEFAYFRNHINSNDISMLDFYLSLKEILYSTSYSISETRYNKIHCLDPSMFQGLSFKIVFVVGLIDGEFPKKPVPIKIIRDLEKNILNQTNNIFITNENLSSNEDFLFYTAINSATDELYLSYHELNEKNDNLLVSNYLDDVLNTLSLEIKDLKLENDSETFYTTEEMHNYYALTLKQKENNDIDDLKTLIDKTNGNYKSFENIYSKWEMENQRCLLSVSEYEGVLLNDDNSFNDVFLDKLKTKFTEISSSHLEMYGQCPHRFLFYHILGLRKSKIIDDSLDSSEKGSAIHKILHDLYQKRIEEPTLFNEENISWVNKEIEEITQKYFEEQIENNKFNSLVLGNELERIVKELSIFVEKDLRENNEFLPISLELEFGKDKNISPLNLNDENGNLIISIKGIIDRIDRLNDKNINVIDYKTGKDFSTNILKKEIYDGVRFQPALYMLKANELFNSQIETWNYYFVMKNDSKPLKKISINLKEKVSESSEFNYIDITKLYIKNYLNMIQSGNFQCAPQNCLDYCEFKSVCRVDLAIAGKKENLIRKNFDEIIDKINYNKNNSL